MIAKEHYIIYKKKWKMEKHHSFGSVSSPLKKQRSRLFCLVVADMLQAGNKLDEPYLKRQLHHFQEAEYDDLRIQLNIKVQVSRRDTYISLL